MGAGLQGGWQESGSVGTGRVGEYLDFVVRPGGLEDSTAYAPSRTSCITHNPCNLQWLQDASDQSRIDERGRGGATPYGPLENALGGLINPA